MNYTRLLYIFFPILFFSFFPITARSQSTGNAFCIDASVFCGNQTITYPATYTRPPHPGITAEAGPSYGCLGTQPNPAWFFMQIGDPGPIIIKITNRVPEVIPATDYDIDFICWGPFTSPTGACPNGLTASKITDCSYSADHMEICTIPNALTGEFYLLMITNFSNEPTDISFSQTNFGSPGAGNTNCNIVINCSILSLSPVATPCDELAGTFTINGTVEFTNPPATAGSTLTITDATAIPPIQLTFNPPFNSPMDFTIPNVPCDGLTHHIVAEFPTSVNPCSFSGPVDSPPTPCPVAVISGGGSICNDGNSHTNVNINITGASGPFDFTYAIDGVSQTPVVGFNGPFPYQISTNTPGSYTVVSVSNSHCPGTASGSATVALLPLPAAPVQTGGPFYTCGTGSVTLTANDIAGTTINWYDAATNGTLLFSGNPFLTPPVSSSTTFYAEAVTNTGGCKSAARTPFIAEVRAIPTVNAVTPSICSGDFTSISMTSTPPGATFSWNSVSSNPPGAIACCYTNPGSGNDITDQLTNTTTNPATATYSVVPFLNQCTGTANPVSVLVNPLPQPSFTSGPASVCKDIPGNVYTTEAGKSNYLWSIPPGAAVTAGGTPASNSVTITWTTTGAHTLSVLYTEPSTLCTAVTPATISVLVKPLPLPSLNSAVSSACQGIAGNVYTTDASMNNYVWSISGGTITAGGDAVSNTATVTWNTVGAGSISVNYIDPSTGCTAPSPTSFPVTIKALPVPSITSSATLNPCRGIPGNVYTTQAGQDNYSWSVTGGTITSGGDALSNTATVTWNTVGPQSISVNYVDHTTQCTAVNPAVFNVTVRDLPSPSFTAGPATVCKGIAGNVYTTLPGMNNYIWTIPPGATVTAGGTPSSNSVTITWNNPGVETIKVNYTDPAFSCTAVAPATFDITINPLPLPQIVSTAGTVCRNIPGNLYTTEAGMNNYSWTITGGTITAGGTPTSNSATVTWNTVGTGYIYVNYINADACTAVSPTSFPVTVNALPVPTITSSVPSSICRGIPGNVYTTEAGNDNYVWTINGGTITSGGDPLSNTATVTWNTVGPGSISVNYTDPFTQCTAALPRTFDVTVKDLPSPSFLSGPLSVCQQVTGNVYITEAAKTGYLWSITGGTITAGGTPTSNTATVTWNTVGTGKIFVNYTEPSTSCTAAAPTEYDVTVRAVPLPTIIGSFSACVNTPGYQYFTEAGKSNYAWNVTGGTTSPGPSPDIINVLWTSTGTYTISVDYTDADGCNATTPTVRNVDVTVLPVPSLAGVNTICTGFTSTYTTDTGKQNYTWTVSSGGTIVGSSTSSSVDIQWNTTGAQTVSVNYSLGSGCTALVPTSKTVNVHQSTAPVVLSSANPLCEGASATYTTQTGMNTYTWTIAPGGVINSGGDGFSFVNVTWNASTNQWVRSNFINSFGCASASPTEYTVNINPLPVATIDGALSVCQDFPSTYAYQTTTIDPLTSYNWQILAGSGTITPAAASNPVSINWNAAGNAKLKVSATSAAGCFASKTTDITVNPKPAVSFISCFDPVTTRNAKRFILKGGKPLFPPAATPQGEYIITPLTPALQYDALSGNYYFNPSLVPGNSSQAFSITYRYTNQFGCPNTTTQPVAITVDPSNATFVCGNDFTDNRVNPAKKYKTTFISGHCWMAENLSYGTNAASGQPQTDNCIAERYYLPSDPACTLYGGLYQWDELLQYQNADGPDYQGLCPPGWHVPSETEWQTLINGADPLFPPPNSNGLVGSILKDAFGSFKTLTNGIIYNGENLTFTNGTPSVTMFWTSTQESKDRSVARGMNDPYDPSISRYVANPSDAFSVRCIKD